MKQTFNLHTHTWRCGHATGQDIEYIENAIKVGFKCIGFSEHIQYRADKGKYNRIDFEDFVSYFEEINQLKKQYSKAIKILCGLEAAYVPEAMQDFLDLAGYCDYILLGQHQGGLNDRKYGLSCNDTELIYYADEIERGIETGLYDIVAHPDFFMCSRNNWNNICEQCAYQICRAAKTRCVPLELNIKGSYSFGNTIKGESHIKYPYREFWEIVADVGNEVLYGWDAHSPKEILRTTDVVDEIVKGLNLKYIEKIEPYLCKNGRMV